MKLGKLLAAGKSIMGGPGEIAYGVNKHIYLPKFGLAKNPFMSTAEVKPATAATETAAELAKKRMLVAAKTQKIPPWPPGPTRAASWASRLNPMAIWRDAPDTAESAPQPVQSELSLEGVKVVHNDLSDADVEVVPIKSRTAGEAAVPVLPPPTKPWEFLAERMFHATTD